MFDADTIRAASRVAQDNGWPLAHLLAVAEVESAGKVFAEVHGVDEPLVRFEGHYFYKRIVPVKRDEAVRKGLARAKAGVVKNPASQQERWDRLIRPAAELDKQAAYESVSWGLGQVMGAHWKALGYGSVLALVDHAREGAAGQIELMARFIRANPNLSKALKEGRWTTFAAGYNGPGYKANAYDEKMAKAARRWAGVKVPAEAPESGKPDPTPSLRSDPPHKGEGKEAGAPAVKNDDPPAPPPILINPPHGETPAPAAERFGVPAVAGAGGVAALLGGHGPLTWLGLALVALAIGFVAISLIRKGRNP